MDPLDKLIADATEVTEQLRAVTEKKEIERQRATVPPAVDPSSSKDRRENRALDLTPQDKAFLAFIRKGQGITPDERKALVEDATGQYLVSPVITTEIDRAVAKLVIMRGLCAHRTLTKDRMQVREIGEASVGWGKLEIGEDPTESTMTPTAPTYKYVEDLYGLSKIGEDELSDSDIDLANLLVDSFARAIAEAEETAFVAGAGHDSSEPEGFTVNATLTGATVTTTAAGALTIEKFLEMVYTCPSKFRKGGSFLVHSLTELALRQLRGDTDAGASTGPFLWQPSVIEGKPNTFVGYPIYTQDDFTTLAGTAGVIAAFGDFNAGYRILDHSSGITVQRLVELYAESGLIGFKVHKRVGGYPIRPANKAIVLLTEHA